MKKITLAVLMLIFTFTLTGCGLLGGSETTTTEDPASTTTVNYDEYIEINSVADLQAIEMNQSYILMHSLDLTDIEWVPLGTQADPYLGNFDGNGFQILNLTITQDNIYNGLFGYVEGNISDLSIGNASIEYEADFATFAGAVAGYSNGDITGCGVIGTITIENEDFSSYIGMLVGFTQGKLDDTTLITEFEPNVIDNNSVVGQITIIEGELGFFGGLAGKTYNTTVSNNNSTVSLDVTTGSFKVYIGGLIGHNYGGIFKGYDEFVDDVNIYIERNYSNSDIDVTVGSADVAIGGFIGYNMKGYNRSNYVEGTIDKQEETVSLTNEYVIKIGGYFGEGWQSHVEDVIINTVADLSYPDNSQNYAFGTLTGEDYLEFTPGDVYVVIPSVFQTTGFLTIAEEDIPTAPESIDDFLDLLS